VAVGHMASNEMSMHHDGAGVSPSSEEHVSAERADRVGERNMRCWAAKDCGLQRWSHP
jgi:hypothetical protein